MHCMQLSVFTSILCIYPYFLYTVIFRNASQSFQFSIHICRCRPEIQQEVGISLTLASSLWGQGGVEMWNAHLYWAELQMPYFVHVYCEHSSFAYTHTKFYATSRNNECSMKNCGSSSIRKNAVACHVASCKGCAQNALHTNIHKHS